jgi:hypothetical protein
MPMTRSLLTPPRPTNFVEEPPQDHVRDLEPGFSGRTNFYVGVIVLTATSIGVLIALRFLFLVT